jgi:hypothetical protein
LNVNLGVGIRHKIWVQLRLDIKLKKYVVMA